MAVAHPQIGGMYWSSVNTVGVGGDEGVNMTLAVALAEGRNAVNKEEFQA